MFGTHGGTLPTLATATRRNHVHALGDGRKVDRHHGLSGTLAAHRLRMDGSTSGLGGRSTRLASRLHSDSTRWQAPAAGSQVIGWLPGQLCENVRDDFCPLANLFCTRGHLAPCPIKIAEPRYWRSAGHA